MIKSVTNLANVDYPFDGDDVFTAAISLPVTDYPGDDERLQFFEQLRERLNSEPSVLSTSISTELPGQGSETDASSWKMRRMGAHTR